MNDDNELRKRPYLTLLPYVENEKRVWSKREAQWFRDRITFLKSLYEDDQFAYGDFRHHGAIDICDKFLEELGISDFHIPSGHGMYMNIKPIIRGLYAI